MKTICIEELLERYSKKELLTSDEINIIDIREADEYHHEHIMGAKNIPLAQVDKLSKQNCDGKVGIFHCRTGHRTEINQSILDKTPFKEKYCLSGGITAWKAAKLPIQKQTNAPIDVMRQVQFIISIIVLSGVGLSYLLSPYFILLTVFAGIGLLIASVTGFCGMASLLKFMPWNKIHSSGDPHDF